MVQLTSQKTIRSARRLGFCYLCGRSIEAGESVNFDHVPPKSVFRPIDRESLKLPTHKACNSGQHLADEKIGELIGLPHSTEQVKPQRLRFALAPDLSRGAITNLDIDAAVWRWVRGFHAALYAQPFPEPRRGALVRADP